MTTRQTTNSQKAADRATQADNTGAADVRVPAPAVPVGAAGMEVIPSAPAYGLDMKDIERWQAAGVLSDSRMTVIRAVDAYMRENRLTPQDVQGWPVAAVGEVSGHA